MADDWSLTPEQLAFMSKRHNEIEEAYAFEMMDALTRFAESDEYKLLFGDMSWDEAYDRYEETWMRNAEPPTPPPAD